MSINACEFPKHLMASWKVIAVIILILVDVSYADDTTHLCLGGFKKLLQSELSIPWVSTAFYGDRVVGEPGARFLENTPYRLESLEGDRGTEVTKVADPRFERNKWAKFKKWMASRSQIAKDYADRSIYRVITTVHPGSTLDAAQTPATVGLTYSKFTRAEIEGKTEAELLKDKKFVLPEEDTLNRLVTRYFDSSGRGIAIEIRVNSKERGSQKAIGNEMLVEMVRMTMPYLKDYPELFDMPIITAYADEEHYRLYRSTLNMDIQTETTPLVKPITIENENHEKLNWWVIETTPRKWEAILFKLKGPRFLKNLNQPHPFELWNGKKSFAAEHSDVFFDKAGHIMEAQLALESEVAPGVFGAVGAQVRWRNREITYVKRTSKTFSTSIFEGLSFEIPRSGD